MATGIALKSCKFIMKQDNGLTATGKQSTRSTTLNGANQSSAANDAIEYMSALASLTDNEVLSYGRKDENLVSDEL